VDETIDKTAKEGGEIELVFNRSRENIGKINPFDGHRWLHVAYTELCERLFFRCIADGNILRV
jgi:hypothetical protein